MYLYGDARVELENGEGVLVEVVGASLEGAGRLGRAVFGEDLVAGGEAVHPYEGQGKP